MIPIYLVLLLLLLGFGVVVVTDVYPLRVLRYLCLLFPVPLGVFYLVLGYVGFIDLLFYVVVPDCLPVLG